MNQAILSGYIKQIDYYQKENGEYETRIFLECFNFNQENRQLLPVKFNGQLAHCSYVDLNKNMYIYLTGEIIFYKENNKYKMFILGNYYEEKSNLINNQKGISKEWADKFLKEYDLETINKIIDEARKKKETILANDNQYKNKAFLKMRNEGK